MIARGLGRSYGDNAQNGGGLVIDMIVAEPDPLDRCRHTSWSTWTAEVNLDQLMRAALPHGPVGSGAAGHPPGDHRRRASAATSTARTTTAQAVFGNHVRIDGPADRQRRGAAR